MSSSPIIFAGDPHGRLAGIVRCCQRLPRAGLLILVGDQELSAPLDGCLRPLYAVGWECKWILGNHDCENHEQYDNLVGSLARYPDSYIGRRVVDVSGLRIAGLSGIFKGRVWYPKDGNEVSCYATRKEYMRQVRHFEWWRPNYSGSDVLELRGMPLGMRDAIFPEDVERLLQERLDVIVSHEAPRTLTMRGKGFAGLNDLVVKT